MSSLHHNKINIQTSQNVNIEYEVGSLGDRYVAGLIDLFVIWTYIGIIVTIIVYVIEKAPSRALQWSFGNPMLWVYLLFILPITFYHPLSELLLGGRSIGKMAMRLKVVRYDGSQLRLGDVMMRWLFRIGEVLFSMGGVAIIAIIINGKGQRLGDMAAGTGVVSIKRRQTIDDKLLWLPTADHRVQFEEARYLTDYDVEQIKDIFEESQRINDPFMLHELAEHLKSVLHLSTQMPPTAFLETILADYYSIHTAA